MIKKTFSHKFLHGSTKNLIFLKSDNLTIINEDTLFSRFFFNLNLPILKTKKICLESLLGGAKLLMTSLVHSPL